MIITSIKDDVIVQHNYEFWKNLATALNAKGPSIKSPIHWKNVYEANLCKDKLII